MKKITYLFGAGASCKELPLAKDIISKSGQIYGLSTSMLYLARELKELDKRGFVKDKPIEFINNTITKLETVQKKASEYDSIDDYAKYLFINKSPELEELKIVLARFFIIKQLYYRKFDKRYSTFLNKILRIKLFPTNVNILTWNYDFQMQIAAGKFIKEDVSSTENANRRKLPLINYFPPIGRYDKNDNFQMVHLNGIAGHSLNKNYFTNNLIYFDLNESKETIFDWISKNSQEDRTITFAWEDNEINKTALNIAKNIVSQTDIFIIIGYSFPDPNYNTDNQIIQTIVQNSYVKIYYQNPVFNKENFMDRFEIPKQVSNNIVWYENTEQFYIPTELLRN
ncbi:MAG: hypothetical protein R2750_11075 [Bacteroidales bacterium]